MIFPIMTLREFLNKKFLSFPISRRSNKKMICNKYELTFYLLIYN